MIIRNYITSQTILVSNGMVIRTVWPKNMYHIMCNMEILK